MMATLLRKIHTYAGLLTFINFMVYGLVGISATWAGRPSRPPAQLVEREFTVPPNVTDREIAEQVCSLLRLSLARPIQDAVIQHDPANRLVLDFYHANGRHRVTVMEADGKLRIEVYRASLLRYLDTLHVTTAAFRSGDWRMQLWADYNEFAMWCLLGMTLSGAALWLMSRPGHRWAQASLAAGCALFTALWVWTR
jgi:hypothetical protein